MSDGDVVNTANEGSVAGESLSTTKSSSVSTNTETPPVAAKPSDAEVRIRNLQSELDKAKANYNALTLEKATLLNTIDTRKLESDTAIATAAEATRTAMAKTEALERENATLKAEVARGKFLIAHPDLMPFAKLVPATTDEDQLELVAREIQAARAADIEAVRATVRSGGAVPPATPSRPSGNISAAEIDRQLKEARGDPKRFEELLAEFAKKAVT